MNTTIILRDYKSSTLPRLKSDYGYKNDKQINKCPYLTYALLYIYNPTFRQQLLFDFLLYCKANERKADPKTGIQIGAAKMKAQIENLIRTYETA